MKNTVLIYFLVCKGLSNAFQEIRPGAGFETGDFVQEKGVGGATAERL